MSYISCQTEENPVTPLINVFQLISLPVVSFGVITPLSLLSGHSVLFSFAIGWASGLGAMIALILVVHMIYTIRTVVEARAPARTMISQWVWDAQTDSTEMLFAAWDFDATADRLDASHKRLKDSRYA